ncbi:hypothetical protein N0V84_001225 [Fusarium piperis]|uniref:Protein kinase domain-containing protein n=1 Tax=Fusarium piperis TaxID=1435070 RepID=A0A9W9BTJ1_9HYPO|nr:hypothetical protein N0V84_001225 [Fusarium piperis]
MRNDTNNKYWRRHVDQDLQPYVCLYRRCTNSLFAHKSDWSKHMATAHSQEWPSKAHSMTWYCDLGHAETAVFDNETDWRKHMRKLSLHPGRSKPPTDAQLDALSAGKQKLARRDPYVCLFCEEKPQRIAILGDRGNSTDMASILVDHIAEHVKSLSFLSLPGLEGAAAEDDARSTNIENTSRKRCRNPGSPPQPASGVEFVEDISLTFDDDDGKAGSQVNKKLAQLDQIDHESNLADRLCDAMESYFDGEKKTKSWLPREALLDICQRSDIFDKLKKTFSLSDAQRYCDYVCGDSFKDAQTGRSAHKIFAILVLIKELEKLGRFVNSGYCDDNLPFTWDDDILQPLNPNQYNEHQSVFKKGEKSFMQSFHAKQWQIHVPFIYRKDNQALEYQLHPETIMPWKSRTPVTKHGGFAKVYMVDIHPGHHAFDGYNKFALKVLRPTDQRADLEGFQRELYALRRTTPGPHVIELLATFKRGGELSFLFPWADEGNLAEIMLKRPPELLGSGSDASRVLTRWLTEQCAGIAEGLHGIHDTQPQIRHDDELDKAEWKDNFGIHGDVKPENILMFKSKGKGKGTSLGELTLSDFGLSRFHSKDSRSNQPGGGIMSLTYASPEQNTYGQFHVSRRSDVWALGCVFSMLLTWAIRGPDALTAYHNARHDEKEPGLSERWHQDTFYGLNVAVNGERTIPDGFFLKKAVIDCIDENKNAISGPDRNSNFLIEFLDFIRDRMLKINFAERARSEEVCRFFDQHTRECGSADYSITLPTLTGSL